MKGCRIPDDEAVDCELADAESLDATSVNDAGGYPPSPRVGILWVNYLFYWS
jgi:hypothetical protein